jgi:phage tail sheath protein FI
MLSIQHSHRTLKVAAEQEVSEGIQLLGAGSAALVGYTQQGPLEEPHPVASETEFQELFGTPRRTDPLAAALRGFFRNGGRTAWVCRIRAPVAGMSSVAMLHRGLDALLEIPDLSLVATPGWTTTQAHRLLLNHCESTRRFAILDAPPRLERSSSAPVPVSSFGACFHPWLIVQGDHEEPVEVPPSGHIAGLLSRLERETGVQRTPEQEVIRDAVGVAVSLTSHEGRQLRGSGVNSIRALSIRGVRLCSAVTCSRDIPDLTTRRVMNLLSQSIERGTPWLSRSVNDTDARERLTHEVTDFLRRLRENTALLPAFDAPEPRIRCDESNNPASLTQAEHIICDVPLSRGKHGEAIPCRISLKIGQAISSATARRDQRH